VFHAELATLLDSVKLTEGVELGHPLRVRRYTFSSDALRSSLLALRHGGEMEAEVAAPVLDATMESVLPTVSEEEIAKKVRRIPPQKPPHRTRT
jgi:hypothetical protein